MSHPDTRYDWEPALDSVVDDIIEGREVRCSTGLLTLHDIIEGDFEIGHRLAQIFAKGRLDQQQALDNLQSDCRKVVSKFIVEHCPELIEQRAADFKEAA